MTLPIKFANYAFSTLAVGCDSAATSLSVPAGHGARFPALAAGEYFYATLENAALNREIVKVTARVDDTLTVVRAQDNTTARSWNAGDSVSLRVNAAAFADVSKAENHEYTPAGTGAVASTVQSKLRELVSVKDFGAVGDGVTDDTVAIQNAINYCTSLGNRKQTLYFPANSAGAAYKITAPLTIGGRINIRGDGQFSTTILASGFSAGQYIIDFNLLAGDVVYFSEVSNITLRGSNTNPVGLRIKNLSYLLMKQVQLTNLQKGMEITGTSTFSNSFEEVTCYAITSYSVHFTAFTGGGQYMFNGCTFTGSDGVVIGTDSSTDALAFYDCNFEQCTTTDMSVLGGVSGLTISACRSEGLDGGTSFLISPTAGKAVYGLTVTGCNWNTDFGNASAVNINGTVKGFSITGNYAGYIGFLQFVNLNGAGEAGVISGNYCANSPRVVNAARAGVVVFSNYNSSGPLDDYWGTNAWNVIQGTFTATATGMTTSPTGTINYSVVGNTVTLDIPNISGTSNATTFTLIGSPDAIRPATDKDVVVRLVDNGSAYTGFARVKTTGVIELYASTAGAGFTPSGTKIIQQNSISYTLS